MLPFLPGIQWPLVCTQIAATMIPVYGPLNLMMALSLKKALFVWGHALAWFLIEDGAKLQTQAEQFVPFGA